MKKTFLSLILIIILGRVSAQNAFEKCTHPFPWKEIKPYYLGATLTTVPINAKMITKWYQHWESSYVVQDVVLKETYIFNDEKKEGGKTTSEAIGYGLVIEALMAGAGPNAHKNFDDLYAYARKYHIYSTNSKDGKQGFDSPYLMIWKQWAPNSAEKTNDSAIDGDMDIAYALLLASVQWGNDGKFNYLDCAIKTIDAIKRFEIDNENFKLERGSDDNFNVMDPGHHFIRMSDFMPANLKAFASFSADSLFWRELINANYKRYALVQMQDSPQLGLFPDYIYEASPGKFFVISKYTSKLKDKQDLDDGGDGKNYYGAFYGFNSCRVPWRIGLDYLLTGDNRAKRIVDKINQGLQLYSDNEPCNLTNVIHLKYPGNIKKIHTTAKTAAAKQSADLNIIAPLTVAALTSKNAQWEIDLQKLLTDKREFMCANADATKFGQHNYYENAIRLICGIIITGNHWTPTR